MPKGVILWICHRRNIRRISQKSPKSPIWKDTALAFLIGGAICVLGQLILDGYRSLGLDKTDAGTATSVTLIFLAALTTGLNLYNSLARFAGAGTLVPITGFANSVVSPAIDFKAEGIITGMAAKMFVIAGPVIVFGTPRERRVRRGADVAGIKKPCGALRLRCCRKTPQGVPTEKARRLAVPQ